MNIWFLVDPINWKIVFFQQKIILILVISTCKPKRMHLTTKFSSNIAGHKQVFSYHLSNSLISIPYKIKKMSLAVPSNYKTTKIILKIEKLTSVWWLKIEIKFENTLKYPKVLKFL